VISHENGRQLDSISGSMLLVFKMFVFVLLILGILAVVRYVRRHR
jgi:hypothetical protein